MVTPLTLVLTCKLSSMHRPVFSRLGTHNRKPYAMFLALAISELRAQIPFLWSPYFPVSIDVTIGADYTRGDLDNYLKGIVDACVKAQVVQDDSQEYVRELRISRGKLLPRMSARIIVSK